MKKFHNILGICSIYGKNVRRDKSIENEEYEES